MTDISSRWKVPMFDLRVLDEELHAKLLNAAGRVLDHGKFFLGPEVEEFEHRVAEFLDTRFAVGVDSGSSALFLALKATGIGVGDEVITTPLTWVITANAIRATGATPIFADIGNDLNIDISKIERLITPKTKAIVPVHFAGHMCEMQKLESLARFSGLSIIEDAAQAFGASLNGKKAGSFSEAAGFSMNPMKALGGYGEAGVVVTNDDKIYKRLKRLRHAGTTSDPKKLITNDCREISLNHKMDTINAALLLVALDAWPGSKRRREEIAYQLNKELPLAIGRQEISPGEVHGRYVYPIQAGHRDALKEYMECNGIETKIMHEPLVPDAPAYQTYDAEIPNARALISKSLIIPSHDKLSSSDVQYIIEVIRNFCNKNECRGQ